MATVDSVDVNASFQFPVAPQPEPEPAKPPPEPAPVEPPPEPAPVDQNQQPTPQADNNPVVEAEIGGAVNIKV